MLLDVVVFETAVGLWGCSTTTTLFVVIPQSDTHLVRVTLRNMLGPEWRGTVRTGTRAMGSMGVQLSRGAPEQRRTAGKEAGGHAHMGCGWLEVKA